MQTIAEPLSRVQIRRIALEFRKLFGLEKRPYFPIVQFVEWILCNPNFGVDLEIMDSDDMDEYAVTYPGNDIIRIRSDVYDGAVKGNPRDRFTLCHELGHYVLHQPKYISFARGDDCPKYKDPEWQASVFAAELMAPYSIVKDWSTEKIADQCGMSMQSANIQRSYYN